MKQQIYDYLRTIPHGKVVTYGQIAEYLGNKHYARVVGNFLHKNTEPELNPCYKVVNNNGELSSHYAFGGIDGQRMRLEKEGIVVENGKVDLKIYRYKK